MARRVAFANNVAALLAWDKSLATPQTVGFRIVKIDGETGARTTLKSYVPFEGESEATGKGKPTDIWPVQAFHRLDLNVREGTTATYEICPMEGSPGNLTAREDLKVITNPVQFTTDLGGGFHVCFNRGTLSSQYNAHMFPKHADGSFDWKTLTEMLKNPGSEFRKWQAGTMPEFLLRLTRTALGEGGESEVLRSSYEVSDPQIIDGLYEARQFVRHILGNTGVNDATNAPYRKKVHSQDGWREVLDRMLREGLIPHNKYGVRRNRQGKWVEVQSGSPNLTWTALCCQANDAWIIESDQLANQYVQNWLWTKEDGSASGLEFRRRNAQLLPAINMGNGVIVQAHFTPNMQHDSVPHINAAVPPDLAYEFELIRKVENAIYGCFFYPGRNSNLDEIIDIYQTRPQILVKTIVSGEQAMPRRKTDRRRGVQPPVIYAQAIEKAFANWLAEALKLPETHAIIHHKFWGLDLAGSNPTVRTKSHNGGAKASYANDENGVVIFGHKRVGRAYMVRAAELRQHYIYRSMVAGGRASITALKPDSSWQKRFEGRVMDEVNYWLRAEEALSE